ncbi:hypothetical protein [Halopiger xanaduensis]|uniref:Uncharacterized protein n=1 Tax=Halopiger xanaduensis (strain DSM 18323 / JCM 14033 / SH-6) TaxID=797210 RepID=F8D7L5_HALXS|nr:hypothetical protein [Halopiger xanaduensis]AEH36504.1 hypothetical protein Halxa_1876 [Halopiger xanaduensis SH-6]
MAARHRQSRRTVIRTIGPLAIAALGLAGSASARVDSSDDGDVCDGDDGTNGSDSSGGGDGDDVPDGATRYVAVVDRIVDGEHVVLLLEKDDEPVDQLVVSVDEFDAIAEGDLLLVDVEDGELLDYEHIDERPPGGV